MRTDDPFDWWLLMATRLRDGAYTVGENLARTLWRTDDPGRTVTRFAHQALTCERDDPAYRAFMMFLDNAARHLKALRSGDVYGHGCNGWASQYKTTRQRALQAGIAADRIPSAAQVSMEDEKDLVSCYLEGFFDGWRYRTAQLLGLPDDGGVTLVQGL